MIEQLFTKLTPLLEESSTVALVAAFVWGLLSVLLSPCHIAGIPLIVGFMSAQTRLTMKKAFIISMFFATGIMITIAIIAVLTSAAGAMLGDIGNATHYIVAVFLILFGLMLLDIIKLPYSSPTITGIKRKGFFWAMALGLIFGLAVGPCTFAFMGPVLAAAFTSAHGFAMLILYGLGHCIVIIVAGTFTEIVQKYMDFNEKSNAAIILRKICGLVIIACAVLLILK